MTHVATKTNWKLPLIRFTLEDGSIHDVPNNTHMPVVLWLQDATRRLVETTDGQVVRGSQIVRAWHQDVEDST